MKLLLALMLVASLVPVSVLAQPNKVHHPHVKHPKIHKHHH